MAGADSEGLLILEGTSEIVDNIFTDRDSGDTPLLYKEPVSNLDS